MRSRKKESGEKVQNFGLVLIIILQLHQHYLHGGRDVVNREVKGDSEQLEIRSQQPEPCKTESNILPQRGNDTNVSVQVHVVSGTIVYALKILLTICEVNH